MVNRSAERQRSYRARLRDGKIKILLRVDQVQLAEVLIASGFLPSEKQDDRAALTKALERVIEIWASGVTHNDTPI